MHELIYNHFRNEDNFYFLLIRNRKRNKRNQGKWELWKFTELTILYIRILFRLILSRPDIVVFSSGKNLKSFIKDIYPIWISKIFNAKVLIELHGSKFSFLETKNDLIVRFARKTLQKVDFIRVLTNSSKKNLIQSGFRNILVLDNGIDLPGEKPTRKSITTFIFIGTHSRQKGFDILIEAFLSLLDTDKNLVLHCIGEWESENFRNIIEEKIKKNTKNFVFHGILLGEEKYNVLKKADVLFLPSLDEGQPLVILESLAFGLLIIATKVGGIPDTIENKVNGILIEPGSIVELKNAAREFLEMDIDEMYSIRLNNVLLFQKRFRSDIFLKHFYKLLQDATVNSKIGLR